MRPAATALLMCCALAASCDCGRDRGTSPGPEPIPQTRPDPEPTTGDPDTSDPVGLAAGDLFTCALHASGRVRCWGTLPWAQGPASAEPSGPRPPADVPGVSDAADLACSGSGCCVARRDGSAVCWGPNLVDAWSDDEDRPAAFRAVVIDGVTDAVEAAVGDEHACARSATGRVLCWGAGQHGQVGDGRDSTPRRPTSPTGVSGATQLTAFWHTSCAVVTDGRILCWGLNAGGDVGDGTTVSRSRPTPVLGVTAVSLSRTCASSREGTLLCWGDAAVRQLSEELAQQDRQAPVAVPDLTGVRRLAMGDEHTCAIVGDGQLWCWGNSSCGQLGEGRVGVREHAVLVTGLTAVADIAVGDRHTCAIDATARVLCWGDDRFGQVGGRSAQPGRECVTRPAVVSGG